MLPSRPHRAHLLLLLTLGVLLLFFQFSQRPNPLVRNEPEAASSDLRHSPQPGPLTRFSDWHRQNLSAPKDSSSLTEIIASARARRTAFLSLMQTNPTAALQNAIPLHEFAKLPPELTPYFERPLSGIGSLDLHWQTQTLPDGSLTCQHQHVLYLGSQVYDAFGPHLLDPAPPQKDLPVSGIVLGNVAVLTPSAVWIIDPPDFPAAASLFPPRPDAIDPLTSRPATPDHAALVGGKLYHFESRASIQHLAESLTLAEESARTNEVFQVEPAFDWLASSGGPVDDNDPPVADTPFMDDTIDVLFIRADFSDFPGAPVTQANLQSTLSAVNGHIDTFSYNKASIVSTVSPTVYRLPRTGVSYATDPGFDNATPDGNDDIHTDASTAAEAHYTLENYDVIAVFFPDLGSVSGSRIQYAGRASIGGSRHWINGSNSTNVILHEFGHNYGLNHSNYRDITESLPGSYTSFSLEYGDIFDVMGSGNAPEGHFNHFHKNRLDWMPDSKVFEVNADGTYRLHRFDHSNALANQNLALKVPMGGNVFYWLGYRQLYTSSTYDLETGAYLVAEGLSNGARTDLIDASPGLQSPETMDREMCGLQIGAPFIDSGVTFEALARGGTPPNEWIDVRVTFAGRIGLVETNIDVDEQTGTAWLTLQRQFNTAGTVSIDFTTSDGSATAPSDYYLTSGTVTWADGDASNKTIAIPVRPDAVAEGTENLTVTLSNPTGASLDALANTATISILDPGARYNTFSPAIFSNAVYAIEPLANGQVLIGGTIHFGSGEFSSVFNLARLNRNGTVDTSLATGTGFNDRVRALAVQNDGKIIVGGDFTNYNGTPCAGLIRLNPNGSIDTNIGGVDNGTVYDIEIESDDKILVGGSFNSFDSTAASGLVRLTTAGARDTVNPISPAFVTPWNITIRDIVIESDQKIVVGGSFYYAGLTARSGIARLHPDGSRDTTFDPGEGAHLDGDPSFLASVYSISRQPDGKYVVGGTFTGFDNQSVTYLARLNNNGSFDATYSPPVLPTNVFAVHAQPNGMTIVGLGYTAAGPRLTRLNESGSTDSTFAIGAGPGGTVYALAQIDAGPLNVGGNYFSFDGQTSRPITQIAAGSSPYAEWATTTFSTAQLAAGDGDPDADPDLDGLPNNLERALGTNALLWNTNNLAGPAGPGIITLHQAGNDQFLQVSVNKGPNNTGAWFLAQFSSDLLSWAPSPSLPGNNAVYDLLEDSSTTFTVRDKTPIGNSSRFVKIGVKSPD